MKIRRDGWAGSQARENAKVKAEFRGWRLRDRETKRDGLLKINKGQHAEGATSQKERLQGEREKETVYQSTRAVVLQSWRSSR